MIDHLNLWQIEANRRLHFWPLGLFLCAAAFAPPAPCLADGAEFPGAFEACASCHAYQSASEPMVGPSLWGVVGRRIASSEGYEYSTALQGIDGVWDRATLDRFLTNPKAFTPGVRMTFGGVRDATDRAAVLDFLERLGPNAVEAPGE